MDSQQTNSNSSAGQPARRQLTAAEVQQLLEKVYRLMLADLQLEQARGARIPRRER
ncbi:MAG: hypothetical protein M3R61_14990 [Chloroflexota bacterium]|nr:hypothetical protein [Chloroflexota bacterium]